MGSDLIRRRAVLRLVAGGAVILAERHASAQRAAVVPPIRLRCSFRVAATETGPVVDAEWIGERLAAANRIFAPWNITFDGATAAPLPARFAEVVSREDRDALARHATGSALSVFVTGRLADVDAPGERRGVHWRFRGDMGVRYVILSRIAEAGVLAHELGHALGLGHSSTPDNVMSYTRTGGAVTFTPAQGATLRASAAEVAAGWVLRRERPVGTRAMAAAAGAE